MSVAPPKPKGPPLNALRAFEAAGRLGGFTNAAEELHVTPGAVAQHIKALEEWFGSELFERRSQGVSLTGLGESVLADFTNAFDQLGEAVHGLRSRANSKHIRIAALPSIAQLWLSPRLPAIRTSAPEITISVTALEHRPRLTREPFDLSIFFDEPLNSPNAVDLGPDVLFPVCAPSLANRLKVPTDLASVPLLHDATWANDWDHWVGAFMPMTKFDTQGPTFSLYSLAVEEAKNGAGVLIGHQSLVRQHLNEGSLIAPFSDTITRHHHLVIELAYAPEKHTTLRNVIDTLRDDDGRSITEQFDE